jgi:hypothetical protein
MSVDKSYFYGEFANNKKEGLGVTVDSKEYTRYGLFK